MILLLRHGQTAFNSSDPTDERIRSWLDIPLNREGMDDAVRAANILSTQPIADIFCSDLVRAVQTAEEVAGQLRKPIRPLGVFRDWNVGDFIGKKVKDVLKDLQVYIKSPSKKVPGGESYQTFRDRLMPAVRGLVADKRLHLVISHARVLTEVVAHCRGAKDCPHEPTLLDKCIVDPGGIILVGSDWQFSTVHSPAYPIDSHKVYMPAASGPFRCDNCEYYPKAGRCSKPEIVVYLTEFEPNLAKVDPGGCCDYFSKV